MPIYEYTCVPCGRSFEELVPRRSDEADVRDQLQFEPDIPFLARYALLHRQYVPGGHVVHVDRFGNIVIVIAEQSRAEPETEELEVAA